MSAMNPTGLGPAAVDPVWFAIVVAITVLAMLATAVMLVRQTTPRTRAEAERLARRREPAHRLAR